VTQQRFWLPPGLSFRAYLKKYPFVFLFSFICAFCWIPNSGTAWFLINATTILKNIPGYSPWTYAFLFGIPFFSLLHLLAASPLLQKFKYPVALYALGIDILYGFYVYLSDNKVTWLVFSHFFDTAGLAAFLWPLAGWKLSRGEVQGYLWNFVTGLLNGFLAYFTLTGIFTWIPLVLAVSFYDFFFSTFHVTLPNQINEFIGPASQTAAFLAFPWYLLGGLEKTLGSAEKPQGWGAPLGPRISFGLRLLVFAGYLFEGFKMFQQWRTHQANYFFDEKILLLFLALFSIGLVSEQRGNRFEIGRRTYTKIISVLSISLLLFAGFLHHAEWNGTWSGLDFYSFFFLQWFIGVFAYLLFRKEKVWVGPVLSLWVLLALTLAGPLNPENLSIRDHENNLKSIMTETGMLKEGLLVKLPTLPDRGSLNQIQNGLYWFAQNGGLNWLKHSFPPELQDLDWDKEKSYSLLPRLLDWLGREKPLTPYLHQNFFSIKPPSIQKGSVRVQQLGDDELQDFNMNQGSAAPFVSSNSNGYFLGFPKQTQILFVFYDGQPLAEVPLEKLAQRLAKYDITDALRRRVNPKDMTLEYENKKVELKFYFSNVSTYSEDGKLKIRNGTGVLLAKRK
jgi:hypothetical protein